MIAASGTETAPVASPLTRPQSRNSCHVSVIRVVSSADTAIVASDALITRRTPARSTRAAANGAPRPKQSRFSETARPIVSWLQPNSSCSGIRSTPVTDRKPDAITSDRNATPATTQA